MTTSIRTTPIPAFQIVHLGGNTYQVHHCSVGTYVYVIKTKRIYGQPLGTYKQRITSEPKIKRILKIAASLPR